MSGPYNQFEYNNFLSAAYVLEVAPLCSISENQVRSERVGDQDPRIYAVYNQNKDRITQQTNLVDKIARFVKDDEEKEEDPDQSAEIQTRYRFKILYQNYTLIQIVLIKSSLLSKGVCRRCKKPGHFEKWCVEDIDESKVTCRFCLGDHYFLKCPNSLCFKCNQAGHMAKDCDAEGFKCHRCNKKGHKSKDCNIKQILQKQIKQKFDCIIIDDENVFEKDKQRLKDLLCINCQERGHLNCFSKGYKKYDLLYCEGKEQREREKMNKIDYSQKNKHSHQHNHQQSHQHNHQQSHQHYHEHQNQHQTYHEHQNQHIQKNQKEQNQNQPHKTIKKIQKYHQQDTSPQYSIWSEESPNTKRMNNIVNLLINNYIIQVQQIKKQQEKIEKVFQIIQLIIFFMFNNPKEYGAQKKDAFRSEIRRIDRERIFNQKRILIRQQNEMREKGDIQLTNLISQIQQSQLNQNIQELKQLHLFAFNCVSTNNSNQITQNQEFLITNNYLQHSLQSLMNKEIQCDVIRTLANSCNHPMFLQQQPQHLIQSLEISYTLKILNLIFENQNINQSCQNIKINLKQVSVLITSIINRYLRYKRCIVFIINQQILIYLGNIANKWSEICQYLVKCFDRLLELSSSADSNLYRNICFCMHNICYVMDNHNLSINDRITCLKILDKGVNRNDCDMLQNEILHPLTVLYKSNSVILIHLLYAQNEEIDKYLISSKIVQYVFSTLKGEFEETTLQVLKQFSLTDTISFSNFLIEQDILDVALEYSNNRKKQIRKLSFLIVINLSYNDRQISNKIVKHKIINRVINGLIASVLQEKQNCIQVIQNLQKTGDNAVYQTLVELGTIDIIGNFIDEVDIVILKIFVDTLCRFLNYAKEVQSNQIIENIKKIKPKLELIYNENKDPKFQDLFQLFLQLLQ